MSADTLKKLRIFAASPSDVASERNRLAIVVEDLKPLAEHVGVALYLVDWRQAIPDMGRPEKVILDQIKPDSWDFFIGILWHRFGTPPGVNDSKMGKEYLSGTEEEFRVAYRLWEQYKRPRVMFYRCMRPIPPDDLDPEQYKRVKNFFVGFAPDADHPGLYQTFDSIESFERRVRQDLTCLLFDYSEQVEGRSVTPEEMQVFVPIVPDNLPRRSAFFGRAEEMEKVMNALSPNERGWGVVIDGIGGIGKTALAVEAAYRCKELEVFDAFIFTSAKQKRLEPSGVKPELSAATTLDEFVTETARVLGKPGIAKLEGEGRRRALLNALRETRALLIYDNLETLLKEEQETLADWLRFLPQGCKAILTSRRGGGEGGLWLRLEKLTWEDARQIILNELKHDENLKEKLQRAGEKCWQELYDETGGSPLALMHILGLLRVRTTLTFSGALALLRSKAGDADLVRFVFQEARKDLSENVVNVLRSLSFFVPSAAFEALQSVANVTRQALETTIDRLSALSLVDVLAGEERYALHPLTRAFVRDELLADANIARKTGMRFARYWVGYARQYGGWNKESYKTYGRLEAEWANLDAAANWLWETANVQGDSVEDKNAAQMLNDLAGTLWFFCWFRGRWDEGVQLSARAYEAMRALNDWSQAGGRAYHVAWIYYNRTRTDDAAQWADRCSDAWSRGGSRLEQACGIRMLGNALELRKDYDSANRYYQDALTIQRELKNNQSIANLLNDLGELEGKRKNYDAAERYCREALDIYQKREEKELMPAPLGSLAELALDRQQWAEARKWFEQELELAKEVGHVELIAQAQYGLARVHEAEGRAELALPLAQEALKIYERLQHRNLAEVRELEERLRKGT